MYFFRNKQTGGNMSAGNTVQQKQSGRLLECVEELPDTAGEGTSWGRHPLDLLLVNREELVDDVMAGGHLVHTNHNMIRVFDSQRSKEGGQQNCHLGLAEGRLWPD